ncbi:alpha/beta fold hydrolase [Anaerosacchariphilus polymeriproducens]|uniref:Alpha/beta hydrolase n=1 Tax=Anaerosacchariphilus polymeriproducens TaxID=1812858 RepID=A0A371AYZ2_9FIRM|nr:alpha/beta hydrolase [Anaerosacchariphilus polymeriproducens]RDU24722.1 alpha/beta hydrolase [Anaerosacchariphilus polymeriproducens]
MDIKLNYVEKGKGKPLILLHGNGENLKYFVHQIEYFSKSYRVIAIDTRGHGKSPRGNRPFTLKQFAEDLKDFVEEKKLEEIILLGFSDGANIALLFALKYPHYLSKLILNGADLHPSGVKRRVQIPIIITYGMFCILSFFHKKWVAKKEMFALMVNQPNIQKEELKKLNIKSLVIAGTNDMIKLNHTLKIHRYINNSKLCVIPGDHFIAKKESKRFNKEVEEFIKENRY